MRTWTFYGIWMQKVQGGLRPGTGTSLLKTQGSLISVPPQSYLPHVACILFQKQEPNIAILILSGLLSLNIVSHPNSQEKELSRFIWSSIQLRIQSSYPKFQRLVSRGWSTRQLLGKGVSYLICEVLLELTLTTIFHTIVL